jgi:hypothetical protein
VSCYAGLIGSWRKALMKTGPRVFKLFWVAGLTVGSSFAQQATPPSSLAPNAQLIRIRIGYDCGWCTGGYDSNETTIEPGLVITLSRSLSHDKKYPDFKTRTRITKQDWETVKLFIDAEVLASFSGPTGCPGCADEPVQWTELHSRSRPSQ